MPNENDELMVPAGIAEALVREVVGCGGERKDSDGGGGDSDNHDPGAPMSPMPFPGAMITVIQRGKFAGIGWNAVYAKEGVPVVAGQNRQFLFSRYGGKIEAYKAAREYCVTLRTLLQHMEPKKEFKRRLTFSRKQVMRRWLEEETFRIEGLSREELVKESGFDREELSMAMVIMRAGIERIFEDAAPEQ